MDLFELPKHINCKIGCNNLYACTYTCHSCRYRIKNFNRCDEHCFNQEDSKLLTCSNCLVIRNSNIKCIKHHLKLGEVDRDPLGDNCFDCKAKYEAYCDSDKFQVYEDDDGLSFCSGCA